MTNSSEILTTQLVKIGLSEDEALAYHTLLRQGSLFAATIAHHLNVLPNAVYRLMGNLASKGFVVQLDTSPKTFQAVPPFIAIEGYVNRKGNELEQTKQIVIASLSRDDKT